MTFWNLKKAADAPEDGVIDIDGEIVAEDGWWMPDGVCSARSFRKALAGVRNVTVHINSPGGDVMAGAEIYSALREHSLNGKGRVTVIVTALAASAASIIAMAGDEILMHPVAYMMIHNPWTVAIGDAKEMRKTAKTLDVISEGLISAYQTRTGKDREELKRLLENETWMSAATCVEEGFADGVYGAESGAAASLARPTMMSMREHGFAEIARRTVTVGEAAAMEKKAAEPETGTSTLTISAEHIMLNIADAGVSAVTAIRGTPEEDGKRAEIARRAEIAQRAAIAAQALL